MWLGLSEFPLDSGQGEDGRPVHRGQHHGLAVWSLEGLGEPGTALSCLRQRGQNWSVWLRLKGEMFPRVNRKVVLHEIQLSLILSGYLELTAF